MASESSSPSSSSSQWQVGGLPAMTANPYFGPSCPLAPWMLHECSVACSALQISMTLFGCVRGLMRDWRKKNRCLLVSVCMRPFRLVSGLKVCFQGSCSLNAAAQIGWSPQLYFLFAPSPPILSFPSLYRPSLPPLLPPFLSAASNYRQAQQFQKLNREKQKIYMNVWGRGARGGRR